MRLCTSSILLSIAAFQQTCALVLPSRHQLAHALRVKHKELHRLSHPSTFGKQHPEQEQDERTLDAGTLLEDQNESQNTSLELEAGNEWSTDTVTIAFEAVPTYPESGAEEHRITIALDGGPVSDLVGVPERAYSIGINRTTHSDGPGTAGREGSDAVVCRFSVEGSEDDFSERSTIVQTFDKADGMVPLRTEARLRLKRGDSSIKLSCVAVNDEL